MAVTPTPAALSGVDAGIVEALTRQDPRSLIVNPLIEYPKSAPQPMYPDEPLEGPAWQFYVPRKDMPNISGWDSPWHHGQPGLSSLDNTDMEPLPNTTAYARVQIQPSVYGNDLQAMLSSQQQTPATFSPSSP